MAVSIEEGTNIMGQATWLVEDPTKAKIKYLIEPALLPGFLVIKPLTGPVPKTLQGYFTRSILATDTVVRFLNAKTSSKYKAAV